MEIVLGIISLEETGPFALLSSTTPHAKLELWKLGIFIGFRACGLLKPMDITMDGVAMAAGARSRWCWYQMQGMI
jgi:hypothetical protein